MGGSEADRRVVDEFLDHLRFERNLSPNTILAYEQDLLQFLTDHLGQEIGIIDWEKRYWRGIVTTTTDPVVEDSRGSFSAQFEFAGELDPMWTP